MEKCKCGDTKREDQIVRHEGCDCYGLWNGIIDEDENNGTILINRY